MTDLAAKLKVAKASVSQAMDTLADLKLIRRERYGPVELSELGREQAEKVRRRHRVLKAFLVEVLSVPSGIAEKDACLLEHVVSTVTMERLTEFLESKVGVKDAAKLSRPGNNMKEDERMVSIKAKALSELSPGMSGRVIRLTSRGQLRRRMLDMGIVPGVEVQVDGVAPLGDPLEITVRGYHLSLRKSEAQDIFVDVG